MLVTHSPTTVLYSALMLQHHRDTDLSSDAPFQGGIVAPNPTRSEARWHSPPRHHMGDHHLPMIYGWSPGIGDPSPLGWITTGAYALATWLCIRVDALPAITDTGQARGRRFWLMLVVAMAALTINKQLDLQSLLTAVGRRMAHDEGWYDVRRIVQQGFIVAVVLVGGIVLGLTLLHMRRMTPWSRIAGLGLTFLVTFVVIRAASFHHIDVVIHSGWAGIYVNHLLELGGIATIAVSAIGDHQDRMKKLACRQL